MVLLAACASESVPVAEDRTPFQTISVLTPGVSGANCFLQSGGMSYPVAAPGKVNVRRSGQAIETTCFKGEHMVGSQRTEALCAACDYPESITVVMALDDRSLDRRLRVGP